MFEVPVKCFSVSCYLLRVKGSVHEVLLLKRAANSVFGDAWCQVAGSIEENETPIDAAYREIREETGIAVTEMYSTMECEQYYRADLNCISILPVFVLFVDSAEMVTLNYEHSEYRWVSFEEARNLLALPIQKKMLEYIERQFVFDTPSTRTKI